MSKKTVLNKNQGKGEKRKLTLLKQRKEIGKNAVKVNNTKYFSTKTKL